MQQSRIKDFIEFAALMVPGLRCAPSRLLLIRCSLDGAGGVIKVFIEFAALMLPGLRGAPSRLLRLDVALVELEA